MFAGSLKQVNLKGGSNRQSLGNIGIWIVRSQKNRTVEICSVVRILIRQISILTVRIIGLKPGLL